MSAYATRDRAKVQTLAADMQRRLPGATEVHRKTTHLLSLLEAEPPRASPNSRPRMAGAAFQGQVPQCFDRLGAPFRDQVPVEKPGQCFLQVGGKFFEQGLYAHAPARHDFELDKNWARFRSAYGLQDGHSGSVVFVVRGDGRELFRSPSVKDQALRTVEVDAQGVNLLELSVEDGGDGTNGDWGVWIWPQLQRSDKQHR